MAIFKVIDNPLDDEEKVDNVCNYIVEGAKDNNIHNCVGRGLSPTNAYNDITEMLNLFDKNKGRRGYHFTVSFAKDEPICDTDYLRIGMAISDFFFPQHQVLFARHKKKNGMHHLHFLVNTASLDNGQKLHLGYTEQAELENYIKNIINDYKIC